MHETITAQIFLKGGNCIVIDLEELKWFRHGTSVTEMEWQHAEGANKLKFIDPDQIAAIVEVKN